MLPFQVILVSALATGLGACASGHPIRDNGQVPLSPSGRLPGEVEYRCFAGELQNYPHQKEWPSWDALWDVNREQVLSSNGGDTYLQHYIMEAILKVASETSVDARLILVTIMQASQGRADTECTGPTPRCGVMHAPKGSSYQESRAEPSIVQMIREGVQGTTRTGPGYANLLKGKPSFANAPVGNPYAAARAYNSGEVGKNLDVVSRGQPGYVNDIANRLLGWNGRGKGYKICG